MFYCWGWDYMCAERASFSRSWSMENVTPRERKTLAAAESSRRGSDMREGNRLSGAPRRPVVPLACKSLYSAGWRCAMCMRNCNWDSTPARDQERERTLAGAFTGGWHSRGEGGSTGARGEPSRRGAAATLSVNALSPATRGVADLVHRARLYTFASVCFFIYLRERGYATKNIRTAYKRGKSFFFIWSFYSLTLCD